MITDAGRGRRGHFPFSRGSGRGGAPGPPSPWAAPEPGVPNFVGEVPRPLQGLRSPSGLHGAPSRGGRVASLGPGANARDQRGRFPLCGDDVHSSYLGARRDAVGPFGRQCPSAISLAGVEAAFALLPSFELAGRLRPRSVLGGNRLSSVWWGDTRF